MDTRIVQVGKLSYLTKHINKNYLNLEKVNISHLKDFGYEYKGDVYYKYITNNTTPVFVELVIKVKPNDVLSVTAIINHNMVFDSYDVETKLELHYILNKYGID